MARQCLSIAKNMFWGIILFYLIFFCVVGNGPGAAPGNCGSHGAQWDRGANLQDYYSRKEEQEGQEVSHAEIFSFSS